MWSFFIRNVDQTPEFCGHCKNNKLIQSLFQKQF